MNNMVQFKIQKRAEITITASTTLDELIEDLNDLKFTDQAGAPSIDGDVEAMVFMANDTNQQLGPVTLVFEQEDPGR